MAALMVGRAVVGRGPTGGGEAALLEKGAGCESRDRSKFPETRGEGGHEMWRAASEGRGIAALMVGRAVVGRGPGRRDLIWTSIHDQQKLLHTWIMHVIVKQHLVQIGRVDGPVECLS